MDILHEQPDCEVVPICEPRQMGNCMRVVSEMPGYIFM